MKTTLNATRAWRYSALLGFAGVALGAFGAHWLREILEANHRQEAWKTGVFYHLIHATVMLALAGQARFRPGPWLAFAAGIALFSGSLYALALGAGRWVGAITPLGGACFLGGYLALAWQTRDRVHE